MNSKENNLPIAPAEGNTEGTTPEQLNKPPLSKRPIGGLYSILCLSTKKQYIGQSGNVVQRLITHRSRLKRHDTNENTELLNDYIRYGKENFVFERFAVTGAEYAASDSERIEMERTILQLLLPLGGLYNQISSPKDRRGTDNPFFGKTHTAETKRKISKSNSGSNTVRKRKPLIVEGIYYSSITEASEKTKIARNLLRARCHSEVYANYKWTVKKEDNS